MSPWIVPQLICIGYVLVKISPWKEVDKFEHIEVFMMTTQPHGQENIENNQGYESKWMQNTLGPRWDTI